MSTVLDVRDSATPAVVEALPDLFEVVYGEIVELPPISFCAIRVANRLCRALWRYLDSNDIGEADVEALYRLPVTEDQTRSRRPDISYISYERWPRTRPLPARGNALDAVPEMVAEVVSPTDTAEELDEKVVEYLHAGVRLVWVVYPITRKVHAYGPGVHDTRVFTVADDLDAGDVLPGFRTPVAGLFPLVEHTPATDGAE